MANLKKLIIEPLRKINPVTVLVLGICSCLAVTAQLKPALVMGASVTVVTALSNLIISLLRKGLDGDESFGELDFGALATGFLLRLRLLGRFVHFACC